ncbi:MAG: anti-sigma regulatory factor [Bacteroidales bacterium]|nr:anti-sigma regulatory factor [Bacteroidales bacterium]
MILHYYIAGGDFVNAGKASSDVKHILKQLDVPSRRIKRVVIALYEAEVNVVAHAREGTIEAMIEPEKIRVSVRDSGPGIGNIEEAMKAGYSTASKEVREMGFGAGMGLPNMKKNSDDLHIESVPGEGTLVRITNYLRD